MKRISLMKTILLFMFLFLTGINCFPQKTENKVIRLYPGAAPGSEDWNWNEAEFKLGRSVSVYNVSVPTLTVFQADSSIATGTAVITCPGGAFHMLSIDSEGYDVAKWLNAKGITVFVLKYRLGHLLTDNPMQEMAAKNVGSEKFNKEIEPIVAMGIADGKTAVAYVRSHAADWGLKTNQIGIMGFSAGGTVATGTALTYDTLSRPDFIASIYPYVGNLENIPVQSDAPPIFIAGASNDNLGFQPQFISLYEKWIKAQKSAELHIYRTGGHGFGMRGHYFPTSGWIDRFYEWMTNL